MQKKATLLLTAAAAAVLVYPAAATGSGPADDAETYDNHSHTNDIDVRYLAAEQGVSPEEAARRIGWQAAAQALRAELVRDFGDVYTELRVDPRDGDRLKLKLTQPSQAQREEIQQRIEQAGIAEATDTVAGALSINELNSRAGQIRADAAAANEGAEFAITVYTDAAAEAIVVVDPAEGRRTRKQQDFLRAERNRGRAVVRQERTRAESLSCNTSGNLPLHCDPPLRGGVRITTVDNSAQCSAGFNTRTPNQSNVLVASLLTAGHCYWEANFNANTTGYFANNGGHKIGNRMIYEVGSNGDAATTQVDKPNADGWNVKPEIVVLDRQETSQDLNYYIATLGSVAKDDRVCVTGGVSRTTRCGKVTNPSLSVQNISGKYNNVFRASVCDVTNGDSGGPAFSGHVALGILQGRLGTCDMAIMPIDQALRVTQSNLRTTNGWQGGGW